MDIIPIILTLGSVWVTGVKIKRTVPFILASFILFPTEKNTLPWLSRRSLSYF
jgi:hypothetical protein